MKIRSLQLKNIGVFEDETIAFPENKEKGKAEIHILTGQNGTGKTTILQALASGLLITEYFNFYVDKLEESILSLENNSTGENFLKRFREKNSICKIKFDNEQEKTVFKKEHSFLTNLAKENIKRALSIGHSMFLKNLFDFYAFGYSGYRFIEHEEYLDIKQNFYYDPLKNALEFNKKYDETDYSLNQWLANTMAKRNSAFYDGNKEDIEKYSKTIDNLKQIIFDIIKTPIDFKFKNEKAKIVAVKNGIELDFDLLPDGLRSIISWLGDLIMRMDALKWKDDLPLFEREFILFLDEIEVHLHPYWQRKILPVIQKLFTNAQIFITTHSPFIVNSIDGAFIYELKLDVKGSCHCEAPQISSTAQPIDEVLEEIYEITPQQMYGKPLEIEIEDFQADVSKAYQKATDFDKTKFLKKAKSLALKSDELRDNVQFELRQLSNSLEEEFKI